jgi:predicted DNA repair protein MutK
MASGLFALLDDVAAIAKVAAASLDDVGLQAAKAGSKAAGVVIDDAAVTPRYVVGFSAARELPIVGKIALGSIRNKLLILLPAALLLSALLPQAITPLLMAGGLFLCFEGAEKLHEKLGGPHHGLPVADPVAGDPEALEKLKVASAIRTDFILSAEIMAIALATIEASDLWTRGFVLAAVAIGITVAVYGAVALIVKADDAGAAMARPQHSAPVRALGRGLVTGMPHFLGLLSWVGMLAMLWVGGGIILHGMAELGLAAPEHWLKDLAKAAAGLAGPAGGVIGWLAHALGAGLFGAALGAAVMGVLAMVRPRAPGAAHA